MSELRHEYRRWLSDHPGHPLGPGAPMGKTLRMDSESHRQAWTRLILADPCCYCGIQPAGSIDHIEPQDPLVPVRGMGGKYWWGNFSASCQPCNESKSNKPLLLFLLKRR